MISRQRLYTDPAPVQTRNGRRKKRSKNDFWPKRRALHRSAACLKLTLRQTRVLNALLDHAKQRFRELGVTVLRTMVRRNDVPVLTFFRSGGFVGGSFAQLEFDLDVSAAPARPGQGRAGRESES